MFFKTKWITEGTLDFKDPSYKRNLNHAYLQFTHRPKNGMISLATSTLINHYLFDRKKTINQWRKDRKTYTTNEGNGKSSKPINYLIFSDHIRKNGYFNHAEFDLYWLHECWLDDYLNFYLTFHRLTSDKKSQISYSEGNLEKNYGSSFPIKPRISREGFIISSFVEPLLDRIIKKRIDLVEKSNNIFSLDWIFDFKNVVNDVVSSVDIILNLIYIKAEFDPLPNWTFDKHKLGPRHGQRLNDKLKWIYKISGSLLNIEAEKESLMLLKNLRNHLSHYDPPCFALSIEEIVNILNRIIDIGIIHLKIRETLKIKPSNLLVNFVLQPEIEFHPEDIFTERGKFDANNEGYKTSVW